MVPPVLLHAAFYWSANLAPPRVVLTFWVLGQNYILRSGMLLLIIEDDDGIVMLTCALCLVEEAHWSTMEGCFREKNVYSTMCIPKSILSHALIGLCATACYVTVGNIETPGVTSTIQIRWGPPDLRRGNSKSSLAEDDGMAKVGDCGTFWLFKQVSSGLMVHPASRKLETVFFSKAVWTHSENN